MKTTSYIEGLRRRAALSIMTAAVLVALIGGGWVEAARADLSLSVGGSKVLDFQSIKRAAVADPAVADYVVLSAKQILVTGKAPGTTDFYVWDQQGQQKFAVVVEAAPSRMSEVVGKIREAIAHPGVRVSAYGDVVLLEGEVRTAEEAERAAAIAGAYAPKVNNLIRVYAGPERPATDVSAIQAAAGPNIKVSALTDQTLLFEGTATPSEKTRLDKILRGLGYKVSVVDMVVAPAYEPRQILVRVKVLDINKSALSDIGVGWGGMSQTREVEYDENGNVITDLLTTEFHDQPILFGEVFGIGATPFKAADEGGPIRRIDLLGAKLKALVSNNKARVLAEPNLLVAEGETAEILVGGEIPIPVVQTATGAATGAAGAITVEWKEFGVSLSVKGTVSGDGKSIDLEVSPEVSTLDYGNAIVVSNILLPALRTRRAHTILHMGDGQTLAIGGLYQTEWVKNVSKIPLLGDLPILGELFRKTDKQRRETELMILVTPEIVTEASAKANAQAALERTTEKP